MAAMHLEQVQRFILAKKIFWGYGHFDKITQKFTAPCLQVCTFVHKRLSILDFKIYTQIANAMVLTL